MFSLLLVLHNYSGSVKRSGSSELVVPEGKQQLADEDIEVTTQAGP